MGTPGKITLILFAAVVSIAAGLVVMALYQTPAAVPTPEPTPAPTATVEPQTLTEPNPFAAEVLNPFDDSAAANPFTTPSPSSPEEEEYINPFSDL